MGDRLGIMILYGRSFGTQIKRSIKGSGRSLGGGWLKRLYCICGWDAA